MNWLERIAEMGSIFILLRKWFCADPYRPNTEYYRSQSELHLLLPLLEIEK